MINMIERDYVNSHTIVTRDVEYAMECLSVGRAINDIAVANPSALRQMNEQATVWNTITVALQESFIITLGRLFDTDDNAHSIHHLMNETLKHPKLFSREALAERKREPHSIQDPFWLADYLDEAWQPTSSDLRYLKKAARAVSRKYESEFKPIRNKVIAHRERLPKHEIKAILDKGLITNLEEILDALHDLLRNLWHLLYNGEKPELGVAKADYRNAARREARAAFHHLIAADRPDHNEAN